jgi:hypothetical protein
MNTTLYQYAFWFLYAAVCGLATFFIPAWSYRYNYAPNGKTESMYPAGFAAITIMHTSHSLMLCIGTKHWTVKTIALYLFAYILFFPAMVGFNDLAPKH